MTAVVKQDSNFTNLAYAVEISPGVVDGSVTWHPLEPNSYQNFGGDVKTKARMPINSSRQLKKGVVVDLDAAGGFEQDLTATNFQDPAQCFLYAALRTKSENSIATVNGTSNYYTTASIAAAGAFYPNDLVFPKKFDSAFNNGLKTVTGYAITPNVTVTDTAVVDGTTQSGILSRVGYEFGVGHVGIDIVTGPYPRLKSNISQVAATALLTNDATDVTANDTVTIGGIVYTFKAAAIPAGTAGNVTVKRGTSATASMTALFHAINNSGGVAGTDYDTTGTGAHPYVVATNPSATTVRVTARVAGVHGNSIAVLATSSHLDDWDNATLTTGAGARAFDSFGLVAGEFVFLGDDVSTKSFYATLGNGVNSGFCRVRTVAPTYLEFDKTQHTMVADNGTVDNSGGAGNTIRMYFGRVLKNESDSTLIIKRGVQIERQLGYTNDSTPTQIQAEYLVRALANNLKIDMKTADIVKLSLDFMANTNELRLSTTGIKTGTRESLTDSDAFNTTSDVSYTKMAIVSTSNSAPSPLFSYFTDLVIEVKNNLKQNKAVSVLGAFDSTPGFFQVQASVTAYFVDVAEMQAVQDNASITLETHLVKVNTGISIDLPLLVLSKALADVKLNEPVMIPLGADAATAKLIDTDLDHTMLWVFWDYLPTLAG